MWLEFWNLNQGHYSDSVVIISFKSYHSNLVINKELKNVNNTIFVCAFFFFIIVGSHTIVNIKNNVKLILTGFNTIHKKSRYTKNKQSK